MKKKMVVFTVSLLLLISGMLVAVGGEAREGEVNESIDSEPKPPKPAALADSPWPMFQHDLNHTGRSPYNTSHVDGTQEWSFSTGWGVRSSPVIGSNGTIYVGSIDKNLYAVSPSGSQKWSFSTDGRLRSAPAVGPDGTIYIGSWDNNLYAVNPNGTERWNFTTGNNVEASPVVGPDGTIYVGSWDNNLYAVNPNGTEKWSFSTGDRVNSVPTIGSDGTIYFGSNDGKLYALNPGGSQMWSFSTWGSVHSSPTIGDDGTIYFGSLDNTLYALDSSGTEKWNFSTGDRVFSSPAIGSDGTIYFGSEDNNVYALNPNGTERWNFTTGDLVNSSPAIGSDGTVYIGSSDSHLYAFDPENGTEKWNFSTGQAVTSSPAIDSDGMVYIGSGDANLYKLGGTVEYDLTINIDGEGSTDPAEGTHTYVEGETVTVEATPDEGWGFVEWTGDYNGTDPTINVTMDANKNITAVFEEVETYQLTIAVEGEGTTDPEPGEHTYENGTAVTVEAAPAEGWEFGEWTGAVSGTDSTINVTMDANKSITAVFEEVETYQLTIVVEGEGTTDPEPGEHTYENGTAVTVEASPAEDWEFVEWTGDESGTDSTIEVTMDANKTITAVLEELDTYDLTINIDGEGSTQPGEGTHTYVEGETVTVEATPAEGCGFVEWTGDESGTDPTIEVTMDANKSITAVFGELYELTITIEGEGSTEPTEGPHAYVEGEAVTIEATSAPGWEFLKWTGDESGTDPNIEVTMDADKSITAVFEEIIEYGLTMRIEGKGSTEPGLGTHIYEEGEKVTVNATPVEDWEFVKWTGDYNGTERNITITMDSDKHLTANFKRVQYYTLRIESIGKGSTDPSEGTYTYEEGEEVTITATSDDEEWAFDEWRDDHTGIDEEITIVIDEDKDITAHFVPETELVEFEVTNFTVDEDGLEVTVTADVKNIGRGEGTLELKAAGEEIENVTLEAGETEEMECTYEFEDEGEYKIELGDQTETVNVEGKLIGTTMLIGIIVVIAIVIAIIVVYMRRGRKESETAEEEETARYDEQESSQNLEDVSEKKQRSVQSQRQPGGSSSSSSSKEKVKRCPNCGEQLRYIKEYSRWYCDNCEEYK